MKNVIITDGIVDAFLAQTNEGSSLAVMNKVVSAAQAAHNNLDQNVQNKLKELDDQLVEINQKASILEDFELGQIEEAFKKFVTTSGMQSVLNNLAVNVGGTSYTVASLINEIANADKVDKTELVRSADGSKITSVRLTLVDGHVVNMPATEEVTDEGHEKVTVATDDWKGMNASFYMVFGVVTGEMEAFGETIPTTSKRFREKTNIVFDLTNKLVEASSVSTDVDLNDDGVIGTSGAE